LFEQHDPSISMPQVDNLLDTHTQLLEQDGELLANAASALLLGDLDLVPVLGGVHLLAGLGGFASAEVTKVGGRALEERIGADLLVSLSVHVLDIIGTDFGSDVARELLLVSLLIILEESLHVLLDVAAEDVLLVDLSIGGVILTEAGGTREATVVVGDIQTTIASTLHAAEQASTSGGAAQTNIEEGLERGLSFGVSLDVEVLTVDVGATLVVQTELGVHAASQQQAGAVSCGVVGQTNLDAVAGELVGVSSQHADIVSHVSGENLADNILVGDADDETVLGGLVLVLVLDDQPLTGMVVGLVLATSLELDLVALEVSLVLNNLDESHLY